MKPSSLIRKTALVVMIIADLAMLGIFAWQGMWFWFTAFALINLVVIIAEIWSAVVRGKTISTFYKYWIQDDPIPAYAALTAMAVAFAALIIHLGVVKSKQ